MRRRDLFAAALLPALPWPPANASGAPLAPLAKGFIDKMVSEHGFARAELEGIFAGLRVNPRVVELIRPPEAGGRKVYWSDYRSRHVTVRNIGNGVLFYKRHAAELTRAAQEYGVPGEIVTAIMGVETRYGTYTGDYTTLESLATLAFTYPPRADYFLGEMVQLFLYARAEGTPVAAITGSYAGAMGYPQFMPTSARTWAVDFDGDGSTDLYGFADSIGSVANFLAEHGWVRGAPVAFPVAAGPNADPGRLLAAGVLPALSAADFRDADMTVEFGEDNYGGSLALIDLEESDGVEYRAGTANYYSLTRYNRSNKYAMAVNDLSREIARRA